MIWSVELRAAKLAVSEALGNGSGGPPRRLPMPRSRYLVVVWRDALALLRAPGRVGSAALWTAAAAAVAALGASADGLARAAAVVMALTLGYLAVGRLAEPARLEADDLRRSAWSPFRFATLMLMHAIVPAGVGAVLALLAAVPFAVRRCARGTAADAGVRAAVRRCRGAGRGARSGPHRAVVHRHPHSLRGPQLLRFPALVRSAAPLIPVTGLSFALDAVLAHGSGVDALGCMVLVALALTAVLLLGASHLANKLRRR